MRKLGVRRPRKKKEWIWAPTWDEAWGRWRLLWGLNDLFGEWWRGQKRVWSGVLKECTTKAHFESLSRLKGWAAEVNLMIRCEWIICFVQRGTSLADAEAEPSSPCWKASCPVKRHVQHGLLGSFGWYCQRYTGTLVNTELWCRGRTTATECKSGIHSPFADGCVASILSRINVPTPDSGLCACVLSVRTFTRTYMKSFSWSSRQALMNTQGLLM